MAVMIRVYIAQSLDGFIASEDGGVAWLAPFDGVDYGYDAFLGGIGTIVMGRATYEQALGFGDWPYPDHLAWILTSRPLEDPPEGVAAWPDGIDALATRLRDDDREVWVVGGAKTIAGLMERGAVDSLELFVMPVLLGAGIPLFPPQGSTPALKCSGATAYDNGVVRLVYDVSSPANPSPTK